MGKRMIWNNLHVLRTSTLFVALLGFGQAAFANAPPSGPDYSDGNYTITYTAGLGGPVLTGLQERTGATGTWVNVVDSPQDFSVTITNKPPGEYFYRTWALYFRGRFEPIDYTVYSAEIRVVVVNGPIPEVDTLTEQLDYTYESRRGDINADGRTDIFVNRTSGGQSGNGALETFILRQLANGSFQVAVPTAGQIATASNWPAAAVELVLDDLNLDGFADIVVRELSNVIAGAVDQIIYASGQILNPTPQGLKAIDQQFKKFLDDARNWTSNPNYFEENAPIIAVPVYVYVPYCYWYFDYYYYCIYVPVLVGYNYYYDFSGYNQNALAFRDQFETVGDLIDPELILGSAKAVLVESILTEVFGSTILRGILGGPCNVVFAYDADNDIPCNDSDLFGQILLWHVITTYTDESDWRFLTPLEKQMAKNNGLNIKKVDRVRVHRRGMRVLGVPLQNEIISPNGHIYIGTNTGGFLPWSEDYVALNNIDHQSKLLHEVLHVWQNRNKGCHRVCMLLKKAASVFSGGYIYMPIDTSKPFNRHNIEQQAEMVQDRFRLANDEFVLNPDNEGVTPPQLNAVIPF